MGTLVVGYGTLLLQASVGTTIGADSADSKVYRPVRVLGCRRLFNLRPTHYEASAKLSGNGIENAAMNVEPTPDRHFSGLAFEASDEELAALDQRERYYERVEVALQDFATGKPIGKGVVYSSRPDAQWIERDPDKLMPLWRDIAWARAGAARISPGFAADYDATTYLADGQTLMIDRYHHVLDDTSDVEFPE